MMSFVEYYYNELSKCFKVTFDRDVVVYRGLQSKLDLSIYNVGYIYKSYIFTSSTIDIDVALSFSHSPDTNKYVQLIKYIIPKGTHICPLFLLASRYGEGEGEILLSDKSIYVVTSESYKTQATFRDKPLSIDTVDIVLCSSLL